jgi:hypothetical protein
MIYEQSIYTVIPGKEKTLVKHMSEVFPFVEKYGGKVMGIFQTTIGNSNEISYILIFNDLAHREKVFQSIGNDMEVATVHERHVSEGPTHYNAVNKILRSTEWSSTSK